MSGRFDGGNVLSDEEDEKLEQEVQQRQNYVDANIEAQRNIVDEVIDSHELQRLKSMDLDMNKFIDEGINNSMVSLSASDHLGKLTSLRINSKENLDDEDNFGRSVSMQELDDELLALDPFAKIKIAGSGKHRASRPSELIDAGDAGRKSDSMMHINSLEGGNDLAAELADAAAEVHLMEEESRSENSAGNKKPGDDNEVDEEPEMF